MKKQNYFIILIITVIIILILTIALPKTPEINDSEIMRIADSNSEVLLLNKVIQSQNRFSECIDEIVKIYEQQGTNQLTLEVIEKTRRCKSSINKKVEKISEEKYLVRYNQEMPEDCKSSRTISNPLNIYVNVNTGATTGNWQNGITFSESAIQDIENSLEPIGCQSYAQYVVSHGTLN